MYNSTFGAQILDTKLETFLLAYFALSVGFLNRASSHVDSWLESQSSCFHNHTSIISRKFLDKFAWYDDFNLFSYWDNKQQSQAQSDQCKIPSDGVPIV